MVNNHGDRKSPNWDDPPSRGETLKVSSWKFIEISWNLTADSLSSARSLESGWPSLREGFPGNLLAKVELIHCQNPEWLWMVGTLEPIWTNGISMQTKEQSQLLYIGWFFSSNCTLLKDFYRSSGVEGRMVCSQGLTGFLWRGTSLGVRISRHLPIRWMTFILLLLVSTVSILIWYCIHWYPVSTWYPQYLHGILGILFLFPML